MQALQTTEHLKAHQGDIESYHEVVGRSAAGRFGPAWWGIFDEYSRLGDDSTLVDLGTGTGTLLTMLRGRQAKMRLIGVDVQSRMLASAQETAKNCGAEIVAADLAEGVPLPDSIADAITAVMVLHELIYPPHVLTEARRLLKPGAHLFLYDWVKRPLANYLQDMDCDLNADTLQHFREHCLFSADDLSFLAERAGFDVCEVVTRRSGNFALVVAQVPQS